MKHPDQAARAFLSSHGWLAQVPSELCVQLLDKARSITLEAGQPLYQLDTYVDAYYGIVSGSIAFEVGSSGDETLKAALLAHPGMWFGGDGLATANSSFVGVHARRRCSLVLVEISDIQKIAAKNSDLWPHLIRQDTEYISRTAGFIHDLLQSNSKKRLLAVLARQAGLREEHWPEAPVVDLTQSELSAVSNVSRSRLSPILQQVQSDGIIRLERARITVLRPDGLLALIDELDS